MIRYGTLSRKLADVSIPILIETFLVMTLGAVDTFMLSRHSDNSVAAVGMVNQLINLVFIIFMVISMGTTILCSQYQGARLKDKVVQVVGISLIFNLLSGLTFSAILYFKAEWLLLLMGLRPDLLPDGIAYMQLVGAFAFFQALSLAISASLRSADLAKYPMIVAGVVNVMNIIGDWTLIFGHLGLPAMGVRGAALATVICRGISVTLLLAFLLRKQIPRFPRELFTPFPWKELKKLLKIGIPSAGEQMSYSFSQVVITYFINMIGTNALITRTYMQNIVMFTYMFSIAVAQGGAIQIGHLVGMKKTNAAYALGKRVLRITVMVTVLLSFITALCGHKIFDMLTDNQEVIALGSLVLWIDILVENGRAINLFGVNALRSAGDIYYPVLIGIAVCWTVSVGLSYLFGITLHGGLAALWCAVFLDENIRGIIFIRRWKSGRWKTKGFV